MDMGVETVRGAKFANETLQVDAREFINCEFRQCSLIYSGGEPFSIAQSDLHASDVVFNGAAENTLNTLYVLYHTGMRAFVEELIEKIRTPLEESLH
jgi:hypothetical protein